ncbi:MAG: hypothetical protein VW262_08655 [Flavobacteriaceae bacterium]
MISVKKLKKAGVMDGAKTQLKKFETETAGEYAKRKQFKGGSMKKKKYAHGGPVNVKANDAVDMVGNPKGKKKPIQIKGWGKARH